MPNIFRLSFSFRLSPRFFSWTPRTIRFVPSLSENTVLSRILCSWKWNDLVFSSLLHGLCFVLFLVFSVHLLWIYLSSLKQIGAQNDALIIIRINTNTTQVLEKKSIKKWSCLCTVNISSNRKKKQAFAFGSFFSLSIVKEMHLRWMKIINAEQKIVKVIVYDGIHLFFQRVACIWHWHTAYSIVWVWTLRRHFSF